MVSAISTWLRNNVVMGGLSLLCVLLAFTAGMFWFRTQSQSDALAAAEAQLASTNKELTSVKEFKDLKKSFVPPVTENDRHDGSLTAEILLVEYSDLECPYCKDLHASINQIKLEYGSKVTHVFRHLPIVSLHPNAPMEAEASECVAKQAGNEGFFKYIDAVFKGSMSKGTSYSEIDMQNLATSLGFDGAKVKSCMDNDEMLAGVDASVKQARDLAIRGTPTWFLIRTSDSSTKQAEGTKSLQSIRQAIDSLLTES